MGNMPAYVAGAALIVGVAGYWVARFLRWLARQWFLRVAWHWLSGWRRDGRPGRPRRAAIHCGIMLGAVVLVACYVASPQVTGWAIVCLLFIGDRKSTRLNSSHVAISYAVFCLKKKNSKSIERSSVKNRETNMKIINR